MVFVAINTWAILVLRTWATVPFHFIWIGVTLMYGWRVWSMKVTVVSLSVIVVVTGVTLLDDVVHGYQEPDELAEIPLMATVFLVMVLYVQRRVTAQRETEQIAAHNLALVEQSRTLVQNASHVLRTPLTIALGHAELLQQAATTSDLTEDAEVVVNELTRLKQITDRFLRLAKSEQPDFLYPVETAVGELVTTTVTRWMATHPLVGLGVVESEVMSLDPSRVAEALDELIGNAIVHCPGAPDRGLRIAARRQLRDLGGRPRTRGPTRDVVLGLRQVQPWHRDQAERSRPGVGDRQGRQRRTRWHGEPAEQAGRRQRLRDGPAVRSPRAGASGHDAPAQRRHQHCLRTAIAVPVHDCPCVVLPMKRARLRVGRDAGSPFT